MKKQALKPETWLLDRPFGLGPNGLESRQRRHGFRDWGLRGLRCERFYFGNDAPSGSDG